MDKLTFALGCIAIVSILEGVAIVMKADGTYFAAIIGIIGACAGTSLGFTVAAISKKIEPPVV